MKTKRTPCFKKGGERARLNANISNRQFCLKEIVDFPYKN